MFMIMDLKLRSCSLSSHQPLLLTWSSSANWYSSSAVLLIIHKSLFWCQIPWSAHIPFQIPPLSRSMTMAEFEGYECEFVSGGSIPPNQLTCSLCTHLLRDPCLVDCCGAKYCQACANHLQTNGQPCNVCRVQFNNAEPDANLQRLVLDQEVNYFYYSSCTQDYILELV